MCEIYLQISSTVIQPLALPFVDLPAHVCQYLFFVINDEVLECMYSDIRISVSRTPYKEHKSMVVWSARNDKSLAGVVVISSLFVWTTLFPGFRIVSRK